jgi:hypothetical protein
MEGWLCPKHNLDAINKKLLPLLEMKHYSLALHSVTRRNTEGAIPAPRLGDGDENKFMYGKFILLQSVNA